MVTQTKPVDDKHDQVTNALVDLLHTHYPGLHACAPDDTTNAMVSLTFAMAVLTARIELQVNAATANHMQTTMVERWTREHAGLVSAAHALATVAPPTTATAQ